MWRERTLVSMHGDQFRHIPTRGDDLEEPARLLSIDDTARVLGGITTREVYKAIERGDLEATRLGRRRLVVVESIDAYVDRLREATRTPVPAA